MAARLWSGIAERSSSLAVRLVWLALGAALAVSAGFLLLLILSFRAGTDLAQATENFAEEERIADEVTLNIMDQLAATFALRARAEPELRTEFEAAGRQAHDQLRRYLFRDLSPEERRRLEEMAEAHQLLEVSGARAVDLFAIGREVEAEASWAEMMAHTRDFLERTNDFLAMRQGHLAALQAQQRRTFRTILAASGALGLLAAAAALLLSWTVHRRVARPLRSLAEASERLGAGELETRVPVWGDPELSVVARAFNRMAASLQGTTRDLEERNRDLVGAMETLRQTQDQLFRSEKLSALGRMSAGLAHELNNPLTSVLGYSELLDERLGGLGDGELRRALEEVRHDFLDPIVVEAGRAQHLVRNLLHFSHQSEVRVSPVSLREAVEVVAGLRGNGFRQAGLEIVVGRLPERPVFAEPHLLQGVLLNTVNNALDALKPRGRGRLVIWGEENDRSVRLLFEDDGPGLPDPERAFEPFFTTKAPGEGTGLGLTLAHRFMEQFGGTIRAENRNEGGARFILTFRKAPAFEAAPEASRPASSVPAAASPSSPVSKEGPARVLVVEDEEAIRSLHARLLERLEVTALLAESAGRAREILARDRVDAILCDVKMPGETGLDFYRWLRSTHPELEERFLFVTGDVSDPELLSLLDDRPDLFFHKPFKVQDYLIRIREVLGEGRGG